MSKMKDVLEVGPSLVIGDGFIRVGDSEISDTATFKNKDATYNALSHSFLGITELTGDTVLRLKKGTDTELSLMDYGIVLRGNGFTPSIYSDDYGMNVSMSSNILRIAIKAGASGRVYVLGTGNVGINEENPSEQLHVDGNVKADELINDGLESNGDYQYISSSYGTHFRNKSSDIEGSIIHNANGIGIKTGGSTLWGLWCDNAGSTNLFCNGIPKLETTATGIEVTGTVTNDGLEANDIYQINKTASGIQLKNTSGVTQGHFYHNGVGSAFGLTVASGSYAVRIVSGGKVGLYYDGDTKLETTTTGIDVLKNTDATSNFGRAMIHSPFTDYATFSHVDQGSANSYSLAQSELGETYLNSVTELKLCVSGTIKVTLDDEGMLIKSKINTQGGSVTGGASGFNGQITMGSNASFQGIITYDGSVLGGESMNFINTYDHDNGGFKWITKYAGTPIDAMELSADGDLTISGVLSNASILNNDGNYQSIRSTNGIGLSTPDNTFRGLLYTDTIGIGLYTDDYGKGIFCHSGGSTYIYHNNIKKLETTATGIDVTGTIINDGLVASGSSQKVVGQGLVFYDTSSNITGYLKLTTSKIDIYDGIGNTPFEYYPGGTVYLSYGSDRKFSTKSTGIAVTGITTTDQIILKPRSTQVGIATGAMYYDSDVDLIKYYNGTAWKTIATV